MKKILMLLTLVSAMILPFHTFAGSDRQAIHASAESVQPLLPGMTAPDFSVRDVTGQPFEFSADDMEKPVVLTFFRGGWCPYCNLHLAEIRKAEAQLKDMGFDIWFISMDKPELLLASLDDPNIGYTIYSDSSLSATRSFGLAFKMPDEMVEKYKTSLVSQRYRLKLSQATEYTQRIT